MSEAARRQDLARADARARRAAREVFDRPLVLEAGAGTGKTTALVTRILAWCCGPGWERAEAGLRESDPEAAVPQRIARRVLRRVVAITFTEAAAAEMDQRVSDALRRVEAGRAAGLAAGGRAARRVASCGASGRRPCAAPSISCVVQTIHAYCRRLLLTYPLEAGLHPRLEVDADGRLQAEIVREVLEERLPPRLRGGRRSRLPGAGGAGHRPAADRGAAPRAARGRCCGRRPRGRSARPRAGCRARPPRARRRRGLPRRDAAAASTDVPRSNKTAVAVAELVDEMSERLEQEPWADAEALAAGVAWLAERWEGRRAASVWRIGRRARSTRPSRRCSGARGGHRGARASALAGISRHLDHASTSSCSACARRVAARRCSPRWRSACARAAWRPSRRCSRETRDLLLAAPGRRARVRGEIDQLLVDEFQDTDRLQCDILRALALAGPDDGATGPLPGGRSQAVDLRLAQRRPRAYDGFVKDVGGERRAADRLSVNYRSLPAILDEVERVIAPVMAPRGRAARVPAPRAGAGDRRRSGLARGRFAPSTGCRPLGRRGRRAARDAGRAQATQLEAQALARDLRACTRTRRCLAGGRRAVPRAPRSRDLPRRAARGGRSLRGGARPQLLPAPRDHRGLRAGALRARPQRPPGAARVAAFGVGGRSRRGADSALDARPGLAGSPPCSEPSPEALEALRAELVRGGGLAPRGARPRPRPRLGGEPAGQLDALLLRAAFAEDPADVFVESCAGCPSSR